MTTLRIRAAVFALIAGAGCSVGDPSPTPTPDDGGVVTPPPVIVDPPPPAPAVYVRASMAPVYQLTPNPEFTRFVIGGVQLVDSDFQLIAGGFADSSASKLDAVAQQLGIERGTPAPTIVSAQDRGRAQQIPFRGNPSDIDIITLANGDRKAYAPVGGDLMTPGNEVSAINLSRGNTRRLVTVGIHPQRTAVHPAGLVFVCNQFSNYISVIDPERDELLKGADGKPVEIKTDFYCTDLAFVPRSVAAPDNDEQVLYVSNGWRSSVFKYDIDIVRDNLSDRIVDVQRVNPPPASAAASEPDKTITGCGRNPYRLSVGSDLRAIFVANNRGGEIARIDLVTGACRLTSVKGPVPDVVQANDILVMATTTLDRGYPSSQEQAQGVVPTQILAEPFRSTGIDGVAHVSHPGAQFDNTKATNFEDLRNGMLTMNLQLQQPTYFTDDISPEANFAAEQKILGGSLPQAIVVNKGATKAWVAMSGSDVIQQFDIKAGNRFRLFKSNVALFQTSARPFALALDEANQELLVSTWGGEKLEIFNIANGALKQSIDLGYAGNAAATYPATTIEKGEFLFYNTLWSNNGRKSCATCHFDELLVDGIEYANGATAPTSPHKIPANFNLATTDSYFWNGSFGNGSYAALASDFQTRSNCELIAFGYVEGIGSNPAVRIGDPNNKHSLGLANDQECQPVTVAGQVLAQNFDDIANNIALTKAVRDQQVLLATAKIGGLNFAQVARATDFYSVSELRIPPNPLAYLAKNSQLDTGTAGKITRGQAVFTSAGCANCHNPNNTRAPFTDGQNHGAGANWAVDFIRQYQQDDRVLDILEAAGLPRALPAQMIASAATHTLRADREINVHLPPVDFFIPGCFDSQTCLVFDDPASAQRGSQLETDRLNALVTVNLANADRGFVPGNVTGSPQANTPSIRANWWQGNFLRHGLAHSLNEVILGPGHPQLKAGQNGAPGETGFAIDVLGNLDVHGTTSTLGKDDLEALVLYVQSIE